MVENDILRINYKKITPNAVNGFSNSLITTDAVRSSSNRHPILELQTRTLYQKTDSWVMNSESSFCDLIFD